MFPRIIIICYPIVKELLQTKFDGTKSAKDFFDKQCMCRLFEKFFLESSREESPQSLITQYRYTNIEVMNLGGNHEIHPPIRPSSWKTY